MRLFKTILTVLILATALAATVIALFWRHLLTPEQKLQYGLTFAAAEDFAERARANPASEVVLGDYVDVLVRKGNLGRAEYLSELYGVRHAGLDSLRQAVGKSLAAAGDGEVYRLGSDPAVLAVADQPVREALRYLEGYQHALLGDWASAKNFFSAIDARQLAPELRRYQQYYLARSYRLAGTEEEKRKIADLLMEVIAGHPDPLLRAKARYNLIAWYLSGEVQGEDGLNLARDQQLMLAINASDWATQKSYLEFAQYNLDRDDLVEAWEMASQALMVNPREPAGKTAGLLCLDVLDRLLADQAQSGSEPGRGWFVDLELPESIFTTLATAGMYHGFAARAAGVLDSLKPYIVAANGATSRRHWEELRVGMSICFRAEEDLASMSRLMADANLANLSEPSLAEIYFQHASLLEARQQYNEALRYFRSVAELGGARRAEALYRRYAILKQVQDPLNTGAAIELLTAIVEDHLESEVYPKAVEELIPLLLFAGHRQEARKLADYVLSLSPGSDSPSARLSYDQTQEVARYWRAYMLDAAGDGAGAAQARGLIPLKYWNYYELTSNYPPQPGLAQAPAVLQHDENPGEYFAGMGLTDSARTYYESVGQEHAPVLLFMSLSNAVYTKPLASRQWQATEILESGQVAEQALLGYVLNQAYPMPYMEEVAAAASEFGVPSSLIYAVIKKESNFKEASVSWVGAEGLMQLMPDTTRWLNSRYGLGIDFERRTEPAVNIRLGGAYLKSLGDDLGKNNIRGMIHSYNGGPGNYQRWQGQYSVDQVLFTDLVPNEQNETFAKKVIKYYKIYDWLIKSGS